MTIRGALFVSIIMAAAGFLTGCDTLDFSQYRISKAASDATDRSTLLAATSAAAREAHLVEEHQSSHALIYFAEPVALPNSAWCLGG